jgi:hypothetical protein
MSVAFKDQLAEVVTVAQQAASRARDLHALKARDGRRLGAGAREAIAAARDELQALAEELDALLPPVDEDQEPDVAALRALHEEYRSFKRGRL